MRIINLISFFIAVNLAYSQDSQLFQYNWRLESIVTDTETYTPSTDPNPLPFGTDFDYLNFFNYTNTYTFFFGIFSNVVGEDILFNDNNQSFEIIQLSLTLGESSEASLYFLYNFLLTEFNGNIENPFTYNFTYVGNLIYLHITNTVGEVATFWAFSLNQQDFLKENISFYPNPVNEILNIINSGIAINSVKIYDLNGRLVLENKNVEDQINLEQLHKGIYILEIETAVGVLREKLVKVD